jgi:hypothetical protein
MESAGIAAGFAALRYFEPQATIGLSSQKPIPVQIALRRATRRPVTLDPTQGRIRRRCMRNGA